MLIYIYPCIWHGNEKPVHHNEKEPHLLQPEKAHA